MNILFFDTKTNGKPVNYRAPMTELDNWPRVIQLAWQIAGPDGELIRSAQHLIRPDGWKIPVEAFWINNGFTTETNENSGIPLPAVLDDLVSRVHEMNVHVIVAHNIAFDYNVLGAEMIRYGKTTGRKLTQICTMLRGTDICQLPGQRGFKWPKLTELYRHFFNKDFDGAHDAGADVRACRECFFEMLRQGHIDLPVTIS